MKGKPILISATARSTFWVWLKGKYGFTDDQIRSYTFNMAPWLLDKTAIQQGYLSSEPYSIEKATGIKPVVMLLADGGYNAYSTTIETAAKTVAEKPDLVQRFVDATIKGCYGYHTKDPSPGNALIKKDNPEMTDDLIANGIRMMNEYGIVDSGDTKQLGIGAMTEARWTEFFKFASQAGIYPNDLEFRKGYTLDFVNKRVGM